MINSTASAVNYTKDSFESRWPSVKCNSYHDNAAAMCEKLKAKTVMMTVFVFVQICGDVSVWLPIARARPFTTTDGCYLSCRKISHRAHQLYSFQHVLFRYRKPACTKPQALRIEARSLGPAHVGVNLRLDFTMESLNSVEKGILRTLSAAIARVFLATTSRQIPRWAYTPRQNSSARRSCSNTTPIST